MLPRLLGASLAVLLPAPPPDHARTHTSFDWCDCRKGLANLTAWPMGDRTAAVTVRADTAAWLNFSAPTAKIGWTCDSMTDEQTASLPAEAAVWGVRLTAEKKDELLCGAATGRVRWNAWQPTPYRTSVPFSSFADGYPCIKIPSLLRTAAGTLLALAEARTPDCGDFAATDLVAKRSRDGGRTWSALRKLVNLTASEQKHGGVCGHPVAVGNAAPVQLSATDAHHPGRILVPHTRSNWEVWVTHSDDDGASWAPARRIPGVVTRNASDPGAGPDCNRSMAYFGLNSTGSLLQWVKQLGWSTPGADPFAMWGQYMVGPWQFIGLGPPGAVQLRANGPFGGRVTVPGYHSYIRGLDGGGGAGAGVSLPVSQLYNNFALGHTIYSDDGGDTWSLGAADGFGGGATAGSQGANENQIVQLRNGSLLANSRSLSTGSPQQRVQAVSNDGGATFSPSVLVSELPEPFNGCQGSIVATPVAAKLFVSHPKPAVNDGIAPDILKLLGANVNLTGRDHMSLWSSADDGASYQLAQLVDAGAAGYSSLQAFEGEGTAASPGASGADQLWLMYEQSDRQADSLGHLSAEALIGALSVLNPDRFVLRLFEDV